MRVGVAWSGSSGQSEIWFDCEGPASIEAVIRASGILERHPEIDLCTSPVGIWYRRRELCDPVEDGERVEIYRPLQIDPKDARRRRAQR